MNWPRSGNIHAGIAKRTGGGPPMKFDLKKSSNGRLRFNLVASNRQIVATSETYARKQSALDTIASIKKNASNADVDDLSS
jgi:uncharacterized protein